MVIGAELLIRSSALGGRFIYCFMGVGIVLCTIPLIGCIAAEAINGFCLCVVSCADELLSLFIELTLAKKLPVAFLDLLVNVV